MPDWLDRWAKVSAKRGTRPTPSSGSGGLSRRDLLKRAGVVTGAAWSAPLIQSAIAPAWAATGTCAGSCPPGTPCSPPGQPSTLCLSGYCGLNGTCMNQSYTGGPCLGTADCQPGHTCNTGTNTCKAGGLGAACLNSSDCINDYRCSAIDQVCGGRGATCLNSTKCLSGHCVGGVCR